MVNKNDKNAPDNKKVWKIFDTIFTAGLFGLFYDSEKARKENDDKRFKQLIYGSLFGFALSAILFIVIFWVW